MQPIYILNISDIHFSKNSANNQGLVLSEFFKDLEDQMSSIPEANRYCIISGDLVNAGNSESYTNFHGGFMRKLYKIIPSQHVFCTPGNHDLNRKSVEEYIETHNELLRQSNNEDSFNESLKDNKYINSKFAGFISYAKQQMHIPNFDIRGYSVNFQPELSVLFLNSSLLAAGGCDVQPNDTTLLSIDTSLLYDWIQQSDGRKKMLVMHHPIESLCDIVKSEINKVLPNIDVFISGHVHDQGLSFTLKGEAKNIHLYSPQLYSDKKDLNGYSIIKWEDEQISSIKYRQWTYRRNKFVYGSDFSDTADGNVNLKNTIITSTDRLFLDLSDDLDSCMNLMGVQSTWCNRTLSNRPTHIDEELHIDYIDILNSENNFQIVAPHNFGLTCFGKYLALKFRERKNETWMFVDFDGLRLAAVEKEIRLFVRRYNIESNHINGIIIDNWIGQQKEAKEILQKFITICGKIRFILLSNFDDASVIRGLDTDESKDGYQLYYLRELRRHDIRQIISNYKSQIDINKDVDFVVDRVCSDIDELNMHRIPSNCIQLLVAYKDNFEVRPVNRARVFNRIIHNLFQNARTLYYNDEITEDECCQVMGCLCFELYKNEQYSFSESEYIYIIQTTYKERFSQAMLKNLLYVLIDNRIIVENNGRMHFRFGYWIYYFVGFRMYENEECFDFMMEHQHYYNPDIIEFHTGINNKSDRAIEFINEKLTAITLSVKSGLNMQITEPYRFIKWGNSEPQEGESKKLIDEDIKKSRLPEDIKDELLDAQYDNTRPYNQSIQKVFDEYDVKNMMNLIRSAARALRNSQLVTEDKVSALISTLLHSIEELFKVLFILTPAMAKSGYAGYGGANFKLAGQFPKEYNLCVLNILCVIPFNVLIWYKNDIFSDKLVYLFRRELQNHANPVIRHFIAIMIANCRPKGWKTDVQNYISKVNKNTYYLSDICESLKYNYRISSMSDSDLKATSDLIKACIAKHETGCLNPGVSKIKKISNERLPRREELI